MKNKINLIQNLDLQYIIIRMVDKKEWNLKDAQETARKYKNFLTLRVLYPKLKCVPTPEIDEIWHDHILHTQNYVRDCKQIFGHYLHHNPSDGSKEDQESLTKLYEETKTLYEKHFNESYSYALDLF